MALSATIALSIAGVAVSSVPREQKVRATVTVSNSSGSPIVLSEIVPQIKETSLSFPKDASSVAAGSCRIDSQNPVPASGSAIYVFDFTPHTSSQSSTLDIGCLIYGNSECVAPTPATVSVTQS
jgi:hypothetical protein